MADRLYMKDNPPRLITSKPGYNASPDLDYIYKTFDSDWFNGAGIRWVFRVYFTYGGVTRQNRTVTFPYALDHVPKYSWFWGGYNTNGKEPLAPFASFSQQPNQNLPMFNSAWQTAPGGGSSQTTNNSFRVYNDRCEIIDTLVAGVDKFGTLIVYQS